MGKYWSYEMVVCSKCNGNKVLENVRHVDNGICYKCIGTGLAKEKIYTQAWWDKQALEHKAQQAKVDEYNAKVEKTQEYYQKLNKPLLDKVKPLSQFIEKTGNNKTLFKDFKEYVNSKAFGNVREEMKHEFATMFTRQAPNSKGLYNEVIEVMNSITD